MLFNYYCEQVVDNHDRGLYSLNQERGTHGLLISKGIKMTDLSPVIEFKILNHGTYTSGEKTFRDWRVESWQAGVFYTDTQFDSKAEAERWVKQREDYSLANPDSHL